MAYVGVTNVPANNTTGLALYTLKEALIAANWTVLASGTGTGGSAGTGDSISTGTGTALGSFARANAWVRIQEPSGSGGREYILQNGNTDNSVNVIIKYSRSTGFASGGTATVAPTTGGGDGVVWIGGGSDATPTQTTWLPGAATGYYHAVANNVAVNGVYGFWWYGYTAGGAAVTLIGTEAVAPGSTATNDNDPSIRYRNNVMSGSTSSNTVSWWEAYGLAGQVYRTGGFLCLYGASTVGAINWPGATQSLSPYTGTVPMFSHLVGASGVIPKGFTTEVVSLSTVQNVCDTFNLSTSNPKINFGTGAGTGGLYGGVAFPWVTSVAPLV